jgi:tRNA pseudouridine55 synthase
MEQRRWHGLLVIDKPAGITSRDAVNRVQRLLPRGTKVGHAGTLDPLATGVLVLGVGVATRLLEYVQRMEKEYETEIVLGARSDTDDAEGQVVPSPPHAPPQLGQVRQLLSEFVGTIQQVPPAYSAAKVAGKRAHDLARRSQEVRLEARPVQIFGIDVIAYRYPRLTLRVRCGKGTYIRSLARDIGERLGCGGYVSQLRRNRIGDFTADAATPLDGVQQLDDLRLLPVESAIAYLPTVEIDERAADALARGQRVARPSECPPEPDGEEMGVFCRGRLIAVCRKAAGGMLAPEKVLRT